MGQNGADAPLKQWAQGVPTLQDQSLLNFPKWAKLKRLTTPKRPKSLAAASPQCALKGLSRVERLNKRLSRAGHRDNNGGNPWAKDQIAESLSIKAWSSNFTDLLAAARDFGLTRAAARPCAPSPSPSLNQPPSASRPRTRPTETHCGSSSPDCSRTMYSAYHSGQFSSYCPLVRSSRFPCAAPARRSAPARSATDAKVVSVSMRPGARVVTSCSSQPLPSGSWNDAKER